MDLSVDIERRARLRSYIHDVDRSAVGSLRIADIGVRRSLLLRVPKPLDAPGLTFSTAGAGSLLRASVTPKLCLRRAFWFSAWESNDALDEFEAGESASLAPFADGWSTRLEVSRVWHRDFPVFPADQEMATDASSGPMIVVTMNATRIRSLPRFLRTSAGAEGRALVAPGMLWAMGFAKPPRRYATVSMWKTPNDIMNFAYRNSRVNEHRDAVDVEQARNFFIRTTALRFKPYATKGELRLSPALPVELFDSGS